jgi:hypothetical protein
VSKGLQCIPIINHILTRTKTKRKGVSINVNTTLSVSDRGILTFLPTKSIFQNSESWHLLSSHLLSKNLKIKIYKTVILPVVLYGCETWSLTLGEEHGQRVFENRVLRKIFGPKREEDGSWRMLYNDELHSLYSSPNIVRVIKSRRMRWVGRGTHGRGGRCLQGFGWEA